MRPPRARTHAYPGITSVGRSEAGSRYALMEVVLDTTEVQEEQ